MLELEQPGWGRAPTVEAGVVVLPFCLDAPEPGFIVDGWVAGTPETAGGGWGVEAMLNTIGLLDTPEGAGFFG